MGKGRRLVYRHRGLAITVLLIVLLNLASFFAVHQINTMEEEYCFDTLYEETNKLSKDIIMHIESDRNQLQAIANIIADIRILAQRKLKNC